MTIAITITELGSIANQMPPGSPGLKMGPCNAEDSAHDIQPSAPHSLPSFSPTQKEVKSFCWNGKLAQMPQVKQDAVQEIKDRLDLVDLISEHLRLQKAGRDLKGLCPFHQEKTPSLYVSPEKQLWHCYGCQKGGDHFTFIQDIEHVDFRGALRLLAEKTGEIGRAHV